MVICLERSADLHIAQLMPLPLTVSCFSKIQIGLPCLVPAYLDSPGKGAIKRVCVCVFVVQTSSLLQCQSMPCSECLLDVHIVTWMYPSVCRSAILTRQ